MMTDWQWHSPWAFYLLALLPIGLLGAWWWQRHRAGGFTYGNTHALRHIRTDLLGWLWWSPALLRVGAMALIIVALARPQQPNYKVSTTKGVDVLICLDMSASMNAVDKSSREIDAHQANNRTNPPSRFDVAKELMVSFIEQRKKNGDRVGLVIFGAQAYLKFPLTIDYSRAVGDIEDLVLDDGRRVPGNLSDCLNNCTISGVMTTIGDALRRGFLRLRDSKAKDKSIILITDGDDRGSKMPPKYVAEYIKEWGQKENPKTNEKNGNIPVYTFLVGGGKNTSMPQIDRRSNQILADHRGLIRYRSAAGQFQVNPQLLREISETTEGKAFESYDEETFREQFKDLEETVYTRSSTNRPDERFMIFVWWALALLGIEALLRLVVFRKFP